MGQTGTKVASKIANSFSFNGGVTAYGDDNDGATIVKFRGATALVYSRRGYGNNTIFLITFFEQIASDRDDTKKWHFYTKC
jgi:hypothetical protein